MSSHTPLMQAVNSIANWMQLADREALEKDSKKYIMQRLTQMLSESDFVTQGELKLYTAEIVRLEKAINDLQVRIATLEKKL